MRIKVLVSGSGKMGQEVLNTLCHEEDMEPVGVVDLFAQEEYISLPGGAGLVPFGKNPSDLITRTGPDVVVDFTNAEWTPRLAKETLEAGVRLVIGTSGLSDDFLEELAAECRRRGVGAVVAPNFAIGAALMQEMSRIAARFFAHAEVIELHHDQKVDAPSATAIATARKILEGRGGPVSRPPTEKETVPGTRGGEIEGVTLHSVRLPGLVAHQEVIFGGQGQTLTIRHDSMTRESFMPGVMLAIRQVMNLKELVVGLDRLLQIG